MVRLLFFCLSIIFPFPSGVSAPARGEAGSEARLYTSCGAENKVSFRAFIKSLEGYRRFQPRKPLLVIVDFSLPSDRKRLIVVDMRTHKLLDSTWVAHGRNSGLRWAGSFSNEPGSYKSSPGYYRIGRKIQSPRHGLALELEGLNPGINDKARQREIIIHGAAYVGEDFIRRYGRCGRSHGCPALSPEKMKEMAPLLANGSLLYIHHPGN
jgi:hypothetical protein